MKFYGEPNLVVINSKTRRKLLQFNENGEYETKDKALIDRLKLRFKYEEKKKKGK